jgi:hypothetical protein
MPKLQEKPSALKREHPELKNMKILDLFLFSWVVFALLVPDPDPQFECGSRSSNLQIRIRIRNPVLYPRGVQVDRHVEVVRLLANLLRDLGRLKHSYIYVQYYTA